MLKKQVKLPDDKVGEQAALEGKLAAAKARQAIEAEEEARTAERSTEEESETDKEEAETDTTASTGFTLPTVRRANARDNRYRLNVFFARGSAALDSRYHKKLNRLKISKRTKVYIAAYTDRRGSAKTNWGLAKKRGQAVLRYLKKKYPRAPYRFRVYGESIARFNYKNQNGNVKNNCVLVLVR